MFMNSFLEESTLCYFAYVRKCVYRNKHVIARRHTSGEEKKKEKKITQNLLTLMYSLLGCDIMKHAVPVFQMKLLPPFPWYKHILQHINT